MDPGVVHFTLGGGSDECRVCHGRRVMKKPIALMLLLASTLTVAACGTDEPTSAGGGGGSSANAPAPAEMLTKAIAETTNQKSAAFHVIANVSGSSDDPQLKP